MDRRPLLPVDPVTVEGNSSRFVIEAVGTLRTGPFQLNSRSTPSSQYQPPNYVGGFDLL